MIHDIFTCAMLEKIRIET